MPLELLGLVLDLPYDIVDYADGHSRVIFIVLLDNYDEEVNNRGVELGKW